MPEPVGVVLAGGGGTRLWPVVGPGRPKPSLPWGGRGRSLLRAALDRACPPLRPEDIAVLAPCEVLASLRALLPEVSEDRLWSEPSARDTGPALVLAAHRVRRRLGDRVMAVLPADHVVEDERAFRGALETALAEAAAGRLVTLGVVPDRPATSYGYLELVRSTTDAASHRVARFVEKPGLRAAEQYAASGRHLWNAGVFAWRTDVFLDAYRAAAPEVALAVEAAVDGLDAGSADGHRHWERAPAGSVDYQLMEKAEDVVAVPLDAGWDDLGDWDAVLRLVEGGRLDASHAARVASVDSEGAAVFDFSGSCEPVALVGQPGALVVRGPEGLLVLKRGEGSRVRKAAARLGRAGSSG